jgi:hypothetical protein
MGTEPEESDSIGSRQTDEEGKLGEQVSQELRVELEEEETEDPVRRGEEEEKTLAWVKKEL